MWSTHLLMAIMPKLGAIENSDKISMEAQNSTLEQTAEHEEPQPISRSPPPPRSDIVPSRVIYHDPTKIMTQNETYKYVYLSPEWQIEERTRKKGPQAGKKYYAEEGKEDNEIQQLFKVGKKKKKSEKTPAEIALHVEHLMAELEVAAEEDAELNRHSKPAINKLKKLPLLTEVLSKKQLQQEFLDHGVLTLLKIWLEPLPDGSLPNINIRTAILMILTDFPIDLEQYDRREQLKKSGLGKVIIFLSRSDEETTSNRKLAKDLVDKWSRSIFNKSTRYEDMRNYDDERTPLIRRPSLKKLVTKASGKDSRDDGSSSRKLTTRPEALPMDFVVRPQSKIDPEEIRARAKHVVQDQRRLKMNKKLQQLNAPKKKQLQATKLSVDGRGMVKFL